MEKCSKNSRLSSRIVKILSMKKRRLTINPFSINVPIMDKPGSWLLPAKCLKSNCGRVTFC